MNIDGKKISEEILEDIKEKISIISDDITLAIILVGDDDASKVYVKNKEIACNKVGMKSIVYNMDNNTSEDEVIKLIEDLSNDDSIHGIILQSPVPNNIDFLNCVSHINPLKDVDALGMSLTYNNYLNKNTLLPCTVSGILKLIDLHLKDISGMNVCIVGRSNLVGKPLSLALLNKDATVTICHSKTKNLGKITKESDILIVACGVPKLIKRNMVKKGCFLIDVGINRVDRKLVGDVDYKNVYKKCSYITPVPKGVGPMTVACLISNTYECYNLNRRI